MASILPRLEFADYEGQVVEYLADEQKNNYGDLKTWNQICETIGGFLDPD